MSLHAHSKSTAQLGLALFRRLHTLLRFQVRFFWLFSAFCIHLWRFLSNYGNMNGMWKCQNVTACPRNSFTFEVSSQISMAPFLHSAYTCDVSCQTMDTCMGYENVKMLLHARRTKSTAQLGSALFRRIHTLLKFLARFLWPLFCILHSLRKFRCDFRLCVKVKK